MTAPLVFIDTETTGLHPDRRAWEIAMIRRDAAGERELLLQITDVDLSTAEPKGLQIGGFYERHEAYAGRPPSPGQLAGAQPPYTPEQLAEYQAWQATLPRLVNEAAAAGLVEEWTRGAHLVGCVPSFDANTLDPMLRRHGLIPAWSHHLIDVEAMAVGWLAAKQPGNGWITPPWRSDDLCKAVAVLADADEALAISHADRHTALGDARWAMRWYDAMVGSGS